MSSSVIKAGVCLTIALLFHQALLAQTDNKPDSPLAGLTSAELDQGQETFKVYCGRCHGILGEGGEGPSLNRAQLSHASTDQSLLSLISQGIPGTGMPNFWLFDQTELRQVAGYVRSLGRLPEEPMPGNPLAGKSVYETSGNCSNCHILNGQGRGIGPELTKVGMRRNSDYLHQSITNPDADQPILNDRFRGAINSFLTVRVVSEYGTFEGMRINEDEFSVQMRDLDGGIHSFEKSKLLNYEKAFGHSLMPGYGAALNETEVNDLVSYLMTLKGEQQ